MNMAAPITQLDTLSVPVELLQDVGAAPSRDAVMQVFLRWTRDLATADQTTIVLFSDTRTARVTHQDGITKLPQDQVLPLNSALLARAAQTRQTQIVTDLSQAQDAISRALNAEGLRSLILVPIIADGEVLGTLNVAYLDGRIPSARELAVMGTLANCIGIQLRIMSQLDAMQVMSHTDPLTGARNRRGLKLATAPLWSKWRNKGMPFSIVAFDLDHFKQVNDTHGHDTGDRVLCIVVERIRHLIDNPDHLIRLGGEEFCLILPGTGINDAAMLAEACRAAIATNPIAISGATLRVSASFGVATVIAPDTRIEDVMSRADAAVYVSKTGGRNRVSLAPVFASG